MDHDLAFAVALVGLLGIGSQWLAWRLNIPSIVVLSAMGLLAGPVLGVLDPRAAFGDLLGPFVSLSVSVILFEGGLRLKVSELREASTGVRRLCTVGLVASFVLGSAAAHLVGGLSMPVSIVLGALLVVTGPTVIMPLLRQARLRRSSASLLKWEGIVNDPIGALLTVLAFEFFAGTHADGSAADVARRLGLALLAGGGLGVAGGLGVGHAFRRSHVPEFLKAPVLLAVVLAVATGAHLVQEEAGLLAATVMGIVVGNLGLASITDLTRFKESITVFLVSGVFIVLTAGMDVRALSQLDLRAGLLLASFLLVVRPAAVLLATVGAGLPKGDRLVAAWIAPRGVVAAAVAGVMGPRLVESGYADGALLPPLVFAMIFLTVVLHGFSLGPLARLLGLSADRVPGLLIVGGSRWATELALLLQTLGVRVLVADRFWHRLRRPRLAGVPVHYGEVLSELAEASLPLHEMDLVLAATDNDAYNALVCVHFGPELGRDRAWQLPPSDVEVEHPRSVGPTLRGRVALRDQMGYEVLHELLDDGWSFQRTTLSETYDRDDWERDVPAEAVPVLMLRGETGLVMTGPRFPLSPGAGDTIVTFAPPQPAPDAASEEPAAAGDATDGEGSADEPPAVPASGRTRRGGPVADGAGQPT